MDKIKEREVNGMAVKIGNSWVSEQAYEYAKSRVETANEKEENGVLNDLKTKFSNTNFRMGTVPFQGSGLNNISIAPNILREMETDPEKRMEYEALIYDCVSAQKSLMNQEGLKAHGFIITEDGGLRAWGISQKKDSNRSLISLQRDKKGNWMQELLESLRNPKQNKKTGIRAAKNQKTGSKGRSGNHIDQRL